MLADVVQIRLVENTLRTALVGHSHNSPSIDVWWQLLRLEAVEQRITSRVESRVHRRALQTEHREETGVEGDEEMPWDRGGFFWYI